jgi:hypothetical protein
MPFVNNHVADKTKLEAYDFHMNPSKKLILSIVYHPYYYHRYNTTKIEEYNIKQVIRNFKFYQTFKPRPSQNSNTFFFLKIIKNIFENLF